MAYWNSPWLKMYFYSGGGGLTISIQPFQSHITFKVFILELFSQLLDFLWLI